MEDVKKWIARYKRLLILLGVVIMMLAPFLWPFFLAIIFQTASIVMPVLVIWAVIKKIQRGRLHGKKRNVECPYAENTDFSAGETVSCGRHSKGKKNAETDSVPKRNKETGKDPLKNSRKKNQQMSDAACIALMWYRLDGRERIFRLMKKVEREGTGRFSISPEGICSVYEENRYRRIGALPSYPCREMKTLTQELRKDHIRAVQKGKYLWLSWGKGCLK